MQNIMPDKLRIEIGEVQELTPDMVMEIIGSIPGLPESIKVALKHDKQGAVVSFEVQGSPLSGQVSYALGAILTTRDDIFEALRLRKTDIAYDSSDEKMQGEIARFEIYYRVISALYDDVQSYYEKIKRSSES
jgi:hypothetical protein